MTTDKRNSWLILQVGTPHRDDLPTMPVVTLLGIWVTALIGSELFGRVMAKHRSNPHGND